MCRLRLPRRAPRNVAHESTVTRPQSAASANAISNFPEADFWGVISPSPFLDNFGVADHPPAYESFKVKCDLPDCRHACPNVGAAVGSISIRLLCDS